MVMDNLEDKNPIVKNETHIGSITQSQVHTGSGNINITSLKSSKEVIFTKDDFLAALQTILFELETARQDGLYEEIADDTALEIEGAEREAKKDIPKFSRIVEKLNKAKTVLTTGTGVITAATAAATAAGSLIVVIENIIQAASKIFM